MRTINQAGLDLIKSYEKCKLIAYKDVGGVWTIGWGSTGPDVVEGLTWTQAQADERFASDMNSFCSKVEALLHARFNVGDNEFAALVSFAYNVGAHALATSHLLGLVNMGEFYAAAQEFVKWDHVNGVVVPGLVRRREAEEALFTSEV